jgi:hypothetical protein
MVWKLAWNNSRTWPARVCRVASIIPGTRRTSGLSIMYDDPVIGSGPEAPI